MQTVVKLLVFFTIFYLCYCNYIIETTIENFEKDITNEPNICTEQTFNKIVDKQIKLFSDTLNATVIKKNNYYKYSNKYANVKVLQQEILHNLNIIGSNFNKKNVHRISRYGYDENVETIYQFIPKRLPEHLKEYDEKSDKTVSVAVPVNIVIKSSLYELFKEDLVIIFNLSIVNTAPSQLQLQHILTINNYKLEYLKNSVQAWKEPSTLYHNFNAKDYLYTNERFIQNYKIHYNEVKQDFVSTEQTFEAKTQQFLKNLDYFQKLASKAKGNAKPAVKLNIINQAEIKAEQSYENYVSKLLPKSNPLIEIASIKSIKNNPNLSFITSNAVSETLLRNDKNDTSSLLKYQALNFLEIRSLLETIGTQPNDPTVLIKNVHYFKLLDRLLPNDIEIVEKSFLPITNSLFQKNVKEQIVLISSIDLKTKSGKLFYNNFVQHHALEIITFKTYDKTELKKFSIFHNKENLVLRKMFQEMLKYEFVILDKDVERKIKQEFLSLLEFELLKLKSEYNLSDEIIKQKIEKLRLE